MIGAIGVFSLLGAILLQENASVAVRSAPGDTPDGPRRIGFQGIGSTSSQIPSEWYGHYDANTVYGATRLAEIEAELVAITKRNAGLLAQVKLVGMSKRRDRMILQGRSSLDTEVRDLLARAKALMPNLSPADAEAMDSLIIERDNILRRHADLAEA